MGDTWEKRGRRAARALLREEGKALRVLRVVVQTAKERVVSHAVVTPSMDRRRMAEQIATTVRAEAPRLIAEMTASVASIRLSAKSTALVLQRAEWETVRREVTKLRFPDPGPLSVSPLLTPTDEAAAQGAALAFTAAWSAAFVAAAWEWSDADGRATIAKDVAAVDVDGRVRRIAATEPARATADARDEGAGWLVEHHGDAQWFPAVLKRWEATNDRKVCPVCSRMADSLPRPLGVSWPNDTAPGYVHNFCRCTEHLIWIPARITGETRPGRRVDSSNPRSPLEAFEAA